MKQAFLKSIQSRKLSALLLLGFASGLPLLLTSRTLQAWMTLEGVDLKSIGLFSLVALPYSLKFLWSPFLDSCKPPFLDRRRGWLIITQIALTLAIAAMALQNPKQALQMVAINALIIAFFSASQDIVTDAYRADILAPQKIGVTDADRTDILAPQEIGVTDADRTDILAPQEIGKGVALANLGYRVAMLLAGSAALILADKMSWQWVYLCLAGFMGVTVFFSLWAPEPEKVDPPSNFEDAVILPFKDFFQRKGVINGLVILIFILLYRLGDAYVNNMVTPFLLQTGFTQTDIGAIQGGMGLIATMVGVLSAGVIIDRLGINRSLWIFGIFQAVSNLGYYILAQLGHNYNFMVIAINIESFCGGLGAAAFTAFLISLCNQRFSATQYALLSSLMAVSRDVVVANAGQLATNLGWPNFFLFTIFAALPGLILLPWFAPWNAKSIPIPRPGLEDFGEDYQEDSLIVEEVEVTSKR